METHACLPVVDQTENYIGKEKILFLVFYCSYIPVGNENSTEKYPHLVLPF